MRVNGGSDLARLQALQRQAFDTRSKLDVAGQELSTNLKASRGSQCERTAEGCDEQSTEAHPE